MAAPSLISCRWDWCRSSFTSINALDTHVKHDHIWPMKPMRKADIALMRRMDLQSLHSSPNTTDSCVVSKGSLVGMSRNMDEALPSAQPTTSNKSAFDTFTQLSSPPQAHSPQRLPISPALEGLVQDTYSGLSAAVEMFERAHGHKANKCLPSRQHSPTHRPLSESSGSSQEVVEQQLTPEDDVVPQPQHLLPFDLQNENEAIDTELRWPTDDELDVVVHEEIRDLDQSVSEQNNRPGSSPDSARGQNIRHDPSDVPLGLNCQATTPPHAAQGSQSQSQPFVLQTQAPYSSQAIGWSQTQ